MTIYALLIVLIYGLLLGGGVVWVRRLSLRGREGLGEGTQQRILDEIDQLDVQIRIANERLKRLEDGMLLNPGEGERAP
jgi:hypothetical protein